MNRWSNWAKQFRSRHRRTARFAGGLGFVFRLPAVQAAAAARVRVRRRSREGAALTSPRLSVTLVFQGARRGEAQLESPARASFSFRSSFMQVREASAPGERLAPPATIRVENAAPLRVERSTRFVRFVHRERVSSVVRPAEIASNGAPVPTTPMAVAARGVQARAWATRVRRASARAEVLNRTPVAFTPARPSAATVPGPRPHEAETATPFGSERPFAPSPAPAAPMNVETLTDHVIKRIDQRLIAYRERMGRA